MYLKIQYLQSDAKHVCTNKLMGKNEHIKQKQMHIKKK